MASTTPSNPQNHNPFNTDCPVYWQDIDANLAENLAWCRRQQHMMSLYLDQYGQRFDYQLSQHTERVLTNYNTNT